MNQNPYLVPNQNVKKEIRFCYILKWVLAFILASMLVEVLFFTLLAIGAFIILKLCGADADNVDAFFNEILKKFEIE